MGEEREMYRTSQTRPSVAVCFLVFNSLRTSSWRVAESAGAASCLSLSFWGFVSLIVSNRRWGRGTLTLPSMSDLTDWKAMDPRTSANNQYLTPGVFQLE